MGRRETVGFRGVFFQAFIATSPYARGPRARNSPRATPIVAMTLGTVDAAVVRFAISAHDGSNVFVSRTSSFTAS